MSELDFSSPKREVVTTAFKLDGEVLHAIKPKGGQLLVLARKARALDKAQDDLAVAEIVDEFMELTMDEPTRARIEERLTDPDDDFDFDTLTEIVQKLQEVWGQRPTTQSNGYSRQRTPTGRASTGRARSRG